MSRVLLTGSRGLLGSRVRDLLIENRHEVIGLDFQPATNTGDVVGSITDKALVAKLVEEAESVIHIAAVIDESSIESIQKLNEINILGTANVLTAAANTNKKVVAASSGSVYGPDSSRSPFTEDSEIPATELKPYGFSKFVNEQTAKSFSRFSDFEWIGLRLAAILGGGLNRVGTSAHLFDALNSKTNQIQLDTNPENSIDWIDVNDAAKLFVLALEAQNLSGVINVSSGVATSTGKLVNQLADIAGEKLEIEWNYSAPANTRIYKNDLCKEILGYTPNTDLTRALTEVVTAKHN